jgi:hypothetical protein
MHPRKLNCRCELILLLLSLFLSLPQNPEPLNPSSLAFNLDPNSGIREFENLLRGTYEIYIVEKESNRASCTRVHQD